MPTDTITPDALRELARAATERAALATPGPWWAEGIARGIRHWDRNWQWYRDDLPDGFNLPGRQYGDGGRADGVFVAAAREDVPALAAALTQAADALELADTQADGAQDALNTLAREVRTLRDALEQEQTRHEAAEETCRAIAAERSALREERDRTKNEWLHEEDRADMAEEKRDALVLLVQVLVEALDVALQCARQPTDKFPKRLDAMTRDELAIANIACEQTGRMQFIEQHLSRVPEWVKEAGR